MPRFVFWTIVLGVEPTAFRAKERDELLPTLKQLQRHHPDAAIKWFARGQLWESPDAAREARDREREAGRERPRGWRPGGDHRDPRDDYRKPRDQKRRELARRHGWKKPGDQEGGQETPAAPGTDDRPRREGHAPGARKPWSNRPPRPQDERQPWAERPPRRDEARKPWSDRPPRPQDERKPWAERPPRRDEARKPWSDRPPTGQRSGGRSPAGEHEGPRRRDVPPRKKPR
jgi:hypothetical protein